MKRLGIGLGLLALPLLEIALLIRAGQTLGLWPMMAIIVGTGMLGITVLVRQRFAVVSGVMNAVNEGKPPLAPVLDGAFLVLAGGLLFSPGLLCDAAGLLLLVPPIRQAGGAVDRGAAAAGRGNSRRRARRRTRDAVGTGA